MGARFIWVSIVNTEWVGFESHNLQSCFLIRNCCTVCIINHDKCRYREKTLHVLISSLYIIIICFFLTNVVLCRYSSTPSTCLALASRPLTSTPRSGLSQGGICSALCSVLELHHHAAESGRQKHPMLGFSLFRLMLCRFHKLEDTCSFFSWDYIL
jgi:hypothetical protein